MVRDFFRRFFAFPALAAVLTLVPALVVAQTPPAASSSGQQNSTTADTRGAMMTGQHGAMVGGTHGGMMAGQNAMMARGHEMMRQWKAMDANLDKLLAEMNASHGQKKVDAMAAVINELVAQRLTMRTMMRELRADGMSSTSTPMHARMIMHGSKDPSSCPMVKGNASPTNAKGQSTPSGS